MGYNSNEIKKVLKKAETAPKKPNPYKKDVIIDPLGQWKYPGQITKIPSGDITMQGVNYPVLGVDNLGNQQMMQPGMDYTFPGQSVTEYPMAQNGGWLDQYASGGPTPEKAREILEDGSVYGRPLTQRQIDFFTSLLPEEEEEAEEQYRLGGQKYLRALSRNNTKRNIKTSLNFLMARNFDIHGLAGTKFYNPDSKFEEGGWLDKYK